MPTVTLSSSLRTSDYIGVGAVIRMTGWGTSRLMRLCMLGEVGVDLRPGRPPRYSVRDIERIMSESK